MDSEYLVMKQMCLNCMKIIKSHPRWENIGVKQK